jgi:hypothetical protein
MNPVIAKTNNAIRASGDTADSEDSVCHIFAVTPQAIGTTPRKPKNVNATPVHFLNALPLVRSPQLLIWIWSVCNSKLPARISLSQKAQF